MENDTEQHLIVISAPSGAGKSTLCQKLLKDFQSIRLSISSTTRQPRGNEQEGIEYFFLSTDEFEKKIQEHRFAEWAKVHGNFYGTSKDFIEKNFQMKKSILLDIDIQGAEQLRKAYPKECFRIFIAPPSLEELERRLRNRNTDSEEVIQKRLKNAEIEIKEGLKFDCVIVNDSLERAYSELKKQLENRLNLVPKGEKLV